ncbi:MAG: DUF3096 domain-containing protein [Chlamydiia bacterium]|nr:DUF3096 domain-containing protein [Chlamydiia bacterium]
MVIFANALLMAILSLIAGVLILIFPKTLNYIVGIYLVIIGILGIFRSLS